MRFFSANSAVSLVANKSYSLTNFRPPITLELKGNRSNPTAFLFPPLDAAWAKARTRLLPQGGFPLSSSRPQSPSSMTSPDPGSSRSGQSESVLAGGLSEQKTVISKRRPIGDFPPGPAGSADLSHSLAGQRLGHFELQECIGGGGMGVVFRGLDTTLGRIVAVKVVAKENTDEETLRRFRNEAQSAARLDHPNIARVYFVGEDRGWNYIVFEYIDGVNIRDRVRENGPLPIEEAISYTLQIAEAVGHAAQRDVVHRDIKPSNILVMQDGRAKLVDMGLARLHQVESNANDLTATGVTLGTFDYISPEQARDPRLADLRSDLYSLGCTFYYMLTGLPPFPDGTVLQKLLSHSSEPPRDPRDIRGELSEEIANIALRLMAKQPNQRYQQPEELIGALLVAADRLGLQLGGFTTTVRVEPRRTWWTILEQHLPWAMPLALLFAAVFVFEAVQRPESVTRADMRPRLASARQNDRSVATPNARGAEAPSSSKNAKLVPDKGKSAPVRAPGDNDQRDQPARVGTSQSDRAGAPASTAKPARAENQTGPAAKTAPAPKTEPLKPAAPSEGTPKSAPAARQETSDSNSTRGLVGHGNVLIVRPDALPDEKSNIVNSLEAAFQKVAATPDVSIIELHFDEMIERPRSLQLPADGHEVTIRAGEGYTPVLVFQPEPPGLASERRMLNLIGGSVAFENIHFRVELPKDRSDNWSLFTLNQIVRMRLLNCSMTIRNPMMNGAAFFQVQGAWVSAAADISAPASSATPKIVLDSCIARGQAVFVKAQEGMPFWLTWNEGFLATTESMVDAGGLSSAALDDVVRITLTNVTAAMNAGLLKFELRDSSPKLPEIGLDFNNCVFVHPRDVPLADYRGITDPDRAATLFEITGKDNFYDFTEVRWRMMGLRGESREFRWEEQDEPWYREKRAERGLRWLAPPPIGKDVSYRTPAEFLLDPSELRLAGFDIELLPTLPERLGRAAQTASPLLDRR